MSTPRRRGPPRSSRRATPGRDLTPLLAAFLNRQGGADVLARALDRHAPPADSAKLALRAVYCAWPRRPGDRHHALTRSRSIRPDQAPHSGRAQPARRRGRRPWRAGRGESIFVAPTQLHELPLAQQGGRRRRARPGAVGQTSPADYIINSILNPDQSIKEQYHTLVVQTSDGQIFQGIVIDKDDQRIMLKEATGAPRVVPVAAIEDQKPGGSLMPKGLANLMTHAEFVDLVRFLAELGKPGPYAIRTLPTIQRWRVLKQAAPALATSIPDTTHFATRS